MQWKDLHYEGTQATSLTWSSCGVVTMENMIVIQKAFPSMRNTRPIYLDLHPGEVYYQPMGWAHSVENLDDSLMVNFWFGRYQHGAITEVRGCGEEREKPKRTIEATRRRGNVLLGNTTWASGQASRPTNTEGHYKHGGVLETINERLRRTSETTRYRNNVQPVQAEEKDVGLSLLYDPDRVSIVQDLVSGIPSKWHGTN